MILLGTLTIPIFTIDNPEFEKYIPDIYPAELQLNKANNSDKGTCFLDVSIKVIGSDIHTSVYDKRDDFGFPIVNFPWLSGDVPRLPSYGIYISQLVRFARCCTSVLNFHSINLHIASKLLTQDDIYHKLRKTFGKFFRSSWSYSELSKFGDISFQKYVFKGISHPVFYVDLVYKLRRVKDTPNFISSGSKIVKRRRRRQYDPLIIERTIGLVLGPCTALYRLFLKHCTLTNKAVGTIWRALSKPPQRRQGPVLRPLLLLVGTPSVIRPELAFSRAEHSLPYSDVTIYIFLLYYIYHLCFTCIDFYDLSIWGGCLFVAYIRRFIYKFLNVCPFDYTAVAGSGKVWPVNQVNHTSWVAVVTPTDRPKSVHNRHVIELFCGVVCVVTLPLWHFCWCMGFCHRTESDLCFFLSILLKVKLKMIFQTSATNFFSLFSVSFLPVLYTVVNYPNTWFTRSFVVRSADKSKNIYNKIQNIWFPLHTYTVLQFPKQCLRINVALLNVCLCVYADCRNWLYVPSGTLWSTSSDTNGVVEIQKDLYEDVHTILSRM